MKKLYSLIKACMTSDMNIFKIKANNKLTKIVLPLFIAICFMSSIWSNSIMLFEKISPMHLQYIVLSMVAFFTAIITIIEGVYKAGPMIFNCKDDQLLLSLPIKRSTVLFVRIFKLYVFELLFNSLFMIPFIVSYVSCAYTLEWTFFLTSFVMLFMLPIIPIAISCVIGAIISSISSRFRYKNISQIIISMVFIIGILYISFNLDSIFNYLVQNASSINDLIKKIYYPAGVYGSLALRFSFKELIVFVLINIIIFTLTIFILSKFYFKINSRLKKVTIIKNVKVDDLVIKSRSINISLIKKELNTFFKTPVFIINAGLGLVLFILGAIIVSFKFDSIVPIIIDEKGLNISKDIIMNNKSLLVFILMSSASYMTSITSSVISLEGKSINILKSLPIKTKTILMSKVYSGLLITTPILLVGNIILFIRFKISIVESLLLIVLSILIPLVSHFIGILVNLKYPKLDAENSTEVVKQSMSSFISVMVGMVLLVINAVVIVNIIGSIGSTLILVVAFIVYLIVDIILYMLLTNKGTKEFNNLSI